MEVTHIEAIINLVEFARQAEKTEPDATNRVLTFMDLADEAFQESYRLLMEDYSRVKGALDRIAIVPIDSKGRTI